MVNFTTHKQNPIKDAQMEYFVSLDHTILLTHFY